MPDLRVRTLENFMNPQELQHISAPEQVAMSIAMVVLRPAMVVRFAKFQVGQSTPKMSDIARFQYLKIECPWVFLSGIYPKGPSQKHVKTLYMYDIYIWGNEHQFYQLFWCSGADSWRACVGSCWVLKSAAWGLEAAEFGSLCGRWSEAASGGGALVHFTFW